MTAEAFYRAVAERLGTVDRELAVRVTAAVLRALRDRLTPAEASQLAAQLPRELQAVWTAGDTADRAPAKMRREAFYRRVGADAGLGTRRDAREATAAVFATLKDAISPGEANDVLAQLPRDLKEIWTAAR